MSACDDYLLPVRQQLNPGRLAVRGCESDLRLTRLPLMRVQQRPARAVVAGADRSLPNLSKYEIYQRLTL